MDVNNILQLSSKYRLGHIPSALSLSHLVDYLYDVLIPELKTTSYEIFLGKPFGSQAYMIKWKELGFISEITEFDSVYTLKEHKNLNIPHISKVIPNSLGNMLPYVVGDAFCNPDKLCITILSDSLLDTGTFYECLINIKKLNITNIIILLDFNGVAINEEAWCSLEELNGLIKVFGLNINSTNKDKSSAFIFSNKKGEGVPIMESNPGEWHYKIWSGTDE